jgi:hypothetical protein
MSSKPSTNARVPPIAEATIAALLTPGEW